MNSDPKTTNSESRKRLYRAALQEQKSNELIPPYSHCPPDSVERALALMY